MGQQARLFPKGPPTADEVTPTPPASGERLRTAEQAELFPPPAKTEADLVDERIAAGRAKYFERSFSNSASRESRRRDEGARSRRKREVRAKTVSVKRMTKTELAMGRLLYPVDEEALTKPTKRADCANVPRPCPFVSCRHNLYLDVSARTGAIKLNFPDLEVEQMPETASCALDVADRNGETLEAVGAIMNLTRERIRQVEVKALAKVHASADVATLKEYYGESGPVGKRRLPVIQPDVERDGDEGFDAEEFASDALAE